MSGFKFELNEDGVRELMKSPEMMSTCQGYADKALSQLGNGYISTQHTGVNRVNVSVAAETYKAKIDNSKDNTILKAVLSQ